MTKGTKPVRRAPRSAAPDARERTPSGLLARDATLSYAQLNERVALSAPAVHERVKRLRRDGVIRGTVARLDGAAVGRPLLAFVHADTGGWGARTRSSRCTASRAWRRSTPSRATRAS